MKICVAQTDIVWEDKAANMLRYETLFSDAASNGAELIVFPEMSLTGFSMDTSLAEYCNGQTCSYFTEMAARHRVSVVFGYAERIGDNFFNRLSAVSSDGAVIGRYSKMHPFTFGGESSFTGGNSAESFDLKDIVFGLTICYDLRFPELYRYLAKNCDCVIVSASWPSSRIEHWMTLLKARAIENQCYIIGCNRTGNGGGIDYCGDSMVIAPDGVVIAFADSRKEQLIYADISADTVNDVRRDFPFFNDRRIDIYRNFYE